MYTNQNTCRICLAYLTSHPTLNGWLKCPSCGFCKVKDLIITLDAFLMGRDKKYPEEYTEEVKLNSTILLEKVNALLYTLKITEAKVSSGWRPAAINATIKNAAKKSNHMMGKAVDIMDDKDQSLAKKILENHELLKRFGLWLEAPESTKGVNTNWVHLDIGTRTERTPRVFKP